MSTHPPAGGHAPTPPPADPFPLTPARRIETLERVGRAFDAVPRNSAEPDWDTVEAAYRLFVELGGALYAFGLTIPEPHPSAVEAALAADLLTRSALVIEPERHMVRIRGGLEPGGDAAASEAAEVLVTNRDEIRDAVHAMARWPGSRLDRVRAEAEGIVAAAMTARTPGRSPASPTTPPAAGVGASGNPFARLRAAVQVVFRVCQERDSGSPPPDAVQRVAAAEAERRTAAAEARRLGPARGLSVERVANALMLADRVFAVYGAIARGDYGAQWLPVNAFGMAAAGVSGVEDELGQLAALCGGTVAIAADRPNPVESGTTDHLLAVGRDTHNWYLLIGRPWEGLTREQRLATHADAAGELTVRLDAAWRSAVGVVRHDSAGFADWERRVEAVRTACVALLSSGNPHGRAAIEPANALTACLRQLEAAGVGYGWPRVANGSRERGVGADTPGSGTVGEPSGEKLTGVDSPGATRAAGPRAKPSEVTSITADPLPNAKPASPPLAELLRVFTNGVSDDRIDRAARVLSDDQLTVNEKLTQIDDLMRIPASASAEQLGAMMNRSKQAVLKSEWWVQNRKGEKADEIGRRHARHKERAEVRDPPGTDDDEDSR